MKSKYAKRGFTVIELMIVIIIMAVLATIVFLTYQGMQQRAKSAVVADTIKKLDQSLRINARFDGINKWWSDNTWTSYVGKPPITAVIAQTGLKEYFQRLPELPGISQDDWVYDNDLDTYNGCSTTSSGVNIYIFHYNDQVSAQQIDDGIDDGNLSCGRLRYDSQGRLLWSIDRDKYIYN